jgi:hypothetical protein
LNANYSEVERDLIRSVETVCPMQAS